MRYAQVDATVPPAFDVAVARSTGGVRRPLRVALVGFGTVGASVARILTERHELASRLRLTQIFNRNVARKRADWIAGDVTWTEDLETVFAAAPDVVVEVMGGIEPARTIVRRALAQGACVVTANKMLLAAHGPELLQLASAHGAQLRFEAAVGGGVPLIHGIREGLAGDNLEAVSGILNGTCNYILSRMEATGEDPDVVLADAQRLGYAEADPSADVDGGDAAAKLVVLAGIAFRRHLSPDAVPTASIRPIGGADFQYARQLGCTIRQLSQVRAGVGGFHAFVGPALVSIDSSFGRNHGANNVVSIEGQYGGTSAFSGAGAGGPATAVAVVSDLLALMHRLPHEAEIWEPAAVAPAPVRRYYVRFVVRDRPGILAAIAAALAEQHVNVDALLQEPGYPKDRLPFVITVEACAEDALQRALDRIRAADWHVEPPLALPMLVGEAS